MDGGAAEHMLQTPGTLNCSVCGHGGNLKPSFAALQGQISTGATDYSSPLIGNNSHKDLDI